MLVLSDLSGGMERAIEYLVEASTQRHSQEDEKVLEWLSSFDYGAEHSDILRRWQHGTGQWLLESAEFNEFVDSNKQALLCRGIPGAGKTIMTATVIDYLNKRFGSDPATGIAYVYFNFKRQSEQTPDAIFLSLMKQLARRQPSLPESVKSLHTAHSRHNTRPQWSDILQAFQEVLGGYSRVFVTIDALDECAASNDCREIILSELISLAQKYDLKLLATSRHVPEISDRFQSALHLEIRASESDVRRYIDNRLSRLAPTSVIGRSESLQEEIKTRIVAAVNGM